jgi:hypothetical protein
MVIKLHGYTIKQSIQGGQIKWIALKNGVVHCTKYDKSEVVRWVAEQEFNRVANAQT